MVIHASVSNAMKQQWKFVESWRLFVVKKLVKHVLCSYGCNFQNVCRFNFTHKAVIIGMKKSQISYHICNNLLSTNMKTGFFYAVFIEKPCYGTIFTHSCLSNATLTGSTTKKIRIVQWESWRVGAGFTKLSWCILSFHAGTKMDSLYLVLTKILILLLSGNGGNSSAASGAITPF